MGLRKLLDSTVEPMTLERAKSHCRVTEATAEDADVAEQLTAARQYAEDYLQRTLLDSTWVLTLDEFPDEVMLPMPPIIAVQSVAYVDVDGVTRTLAPSAYALDNSGDMGWLRPAYGTSWPVARDQMNAVSITYRAGYGTSPANVPAPIRQWVARVLGDLYAFRERSSERPVQLGGAVDDAVDRYRVVLL